MKFLILLLISTTVVILGKLYYEAKDSTKRTIKICFWSILIVLLICFSSAPMLESALSRGLMGGLVGLIGTLFFLAIYGVIVAIPYLIKRSKKQLKQNKLAPFKVEIVNDKKYINLKQNKRIEFLHNLKKQTAATLTKQHKELETEVNKLKDVPADVAKYIKPKDTSALKDNISKLEYKLMAIDELLSAETAKTKQQKKSPTKNYVDD